MVIWKQPQRFDGIPRGELAEIFPEFDPFPKGEPDGTKQLWHIVRNTDLKKALDAWHMAIEKHVWDSRGPMRWEFK